MGTDLAERPLRSQGLTANRALHDLVEDAPWMDPGEALLWCVALAAQDVRWLNMQISELQRATVRPQTDVTGSTEKEGHHNKKTRAARQLHQYLLQRFAAEERLARFAKMALDAGVAERLVKLAERMGEFIAPILEEVLEQLKLTPAQKRKAPGIIEGALRQMEAA